MNPSDAVLIRFPQADLQAGELRPVPVIALTMGLHGDLPLALMSSRIQQAVIGFDDMLEDTDPDFLDTNLKVSSVDRLARLATVEASLINACLGGISPECLETIKVHLA